MSNILKQIKFVSSWSGKNGPLRWLAQYWIYPYRWHRICHCLALILSMETAKSAASGPIVSAGCSRGQGQGFSPEAVQHSAETADKLARSMQSWEDCHQDCVHIYSQAGSATSIACRLLVVDARKPDSVTECPKTLTSSQQRVHSI